MMAERKLVEAAVADPANTWFVLLSETTVPLYPPALLWQQLMSEQRSKINACKDGVSGGWVRPAGTGAPAPILDGAAGQAGRWGQRQLLRGGAACWASQRLSCARPLQKRTLPLPAPPAGHQEGGEKTREKGVHFCWACWASRQARAE